MPNDPLSRKLTVLLSAAMLVAGAALGLWLVTNVPPLPGRGDAAAAAAGALASPLGAPAGGQPESVLPQPEQAHSAEGEQAAAPTPLAETAAQPAAHETLLTVALADGLSPALAALPPGAAGLLTVTADSAAADLVLGLERSGGRPVQSLLFAAAARFDTIDPQITWSDLRAAWRTETVTYTAVAVIADTLPALEQVLGPAGPHVQGQATITEVVEAVWDQPATLALVPFEQLTPRLAVLALDGQNPVENAAKFDPAAYPLAATVYARPRPGADPARVDAVLAALPESNRQADRLTVVAMTGVTAMTRMTAAQMDRFGPAWPAEVVGPELAAADITHISNETPFVEGCVTNTDPENFNFCTKPEYMATLTASGVDIIGLTGNHQNDFGRENALKSLDIYAEAGLPVYGGGRNKEEAFAPYFVEHNGNRLAFLGANSYGPDFAWATDTQPGSAEFDLAIMSAIIRSIKQKGLADVVLAELQYQESYEVHPLADQRDNFNALVRAGADIVTGVQSHVPQAVEFTDGKLVLYGLGNLYFDQMWSQPTREGLIVKHTFYAGRHISTQVLTTMLHEYGQPRWTTPAEERQILRRVFDASYWE